jgi:hypothetical protein
MLIKSVDDKSKRIKLLEELQQSSWLDLRQKQWLRDQLQALRRGIQGEKESAFYLDSHFKDSPYHMLIHDLRLVVDGEVAQIDHLYIARSGIFVLFETKYYTGSLKVNEQGEFTVLYDDGAQYGIPSPIEQSRRHERILLKLLERLEIGGRVFKVPEVFHLVLMHPSSIIGRPSPHKFDTSFLLKADQFPQWHKKFTDDVDAVSMVKSMLNLRSPETIRDWAKKLTRQHRPASQFDLPDFMKPKAQDMVSQKTAETTRTLQSKEHAVVALQPDMSLAKQLICAHCLEKISPGVGQYCWGMPKRFGGLQYCMKHQSLFK